MRTLAKDSSFLSRKAHPKVISMIDDLEILGHWKLIELSTIAASTTLDLQ